MIWYIEHYPLKMVLMCVIKWGNSLM
jgi:hypothetical protein